MGYEQELTMAKPVHRFGDSNSAGGVVAGPLQDFVFDQGKLVSVDGSGVSGHAPFAPPHVAPVTANGSSFVRINGIPVNFEGNADSCGHPRATGSDIFFITE
jgi:uncharacterized Zn-binding protein involved in type VI secretion